MSWPRCGASRAHEPHALTRSTASFAVTVLPGCSGCHCEGASTHAAIARVHRQEVDERHSGFRSRPPATSSSSAGGAAGVATKGEAARDERASTRCLRSRGAQARFVGYLVAGVASVVPMQIGFPSNAVALPGLVRCGDLADRDFHVIRLSPRARPPACRPRLAPFLPGAWKRCPPRRPAVTIDSAQRGCWCLRSVVESNGSNKTKATSTTSPSSVTQKAGPDDGPGAACAGR